MPGQSGCGGAADSPGERDRQVLHLLDPRGRQTIMSQGQLRLMTDAETGIFVQTSNTYGGGGAGEVAKGRQARGLKSAGGFPNFFASSPPTPPGFFRFGSLRARQLSFPGAN